MNYYGLLAFVFIICFVITELVKRYIIKRKITVIVKHKNGNVSKHRVFAGNDPEVDALLAEAKSKAKQIT
jgi:hypothetical protein